MRWVPLTSVHPNESVIIRRIHELAEQNSSLVALLESQGILPGARVTVDEVLPFNQTISLRMEKEAATLGFASARYVFVEH